MPGQKTPDGTIDRSIGGVGKTAMILKQSQKQEEAWQFLKWWTDMEAQVRYGTELEALLGVEARWNTANVDALQQLPWPRRDLDAILEQWEFFRETPVVLGGYFTGAISETPGTGWCCKASSPRGAGRRPQIDRTGAGQETGRVRYHTNSPLLLQGGGDAVTTLEQAARVPKARPGFAERWSIIRSELWKWRWGYLMMSPFMILFFVYTILPVVTSLTSPLPTSTYWRPPSGSAGPTTKMLFVEDDIFVKAVSNTLGFAIATGPVAYFVALLFAWLINQISARYRYIYVMLFYAPSLLAGISVGVVWTYFLSGDRYGLINNVLLKLGILDEPYLWMTNVKTIMPAIVVVSLWMSLGTGFLAFLAGLQNVPGELYEAGRVDGIRSKWQELFFITLPSMKPQLLFGAVMQVVASFKVFDVSMALAGFPSHLYAGHTILTHLYDYAFIRFEMGYAAAISVVLFVMMFGLSRFCMAVLSSKGE